MAKKTTGKEARLMADERVIAHASDFFSQHSMKFVLIFVIMMAVVVVWVVNAHASRSFEEEVGDYLEEHVFTPLRVNEIGRLYRFLPEEDVGIDAVNCLPDLPDERGDLHRLPLRVLVVVPAFRQHLIRP